MKTMGGDATVESDDARMRVLLELRPCFDGFTGISQETRVLFSAFHELDAIEPVGLINHSKRLLAKGKPGWFDRRDSASDYDRVAKLIVSCEDEEAATPLDRLRLRTEQHRSVASLGWHSVTGAPITVDEVHGQKFGDYLWQRLFDKALEPDEFDRIRNAAYVSMRSPWLAMHTVGAFGRYPRLDTRGFDIFVAQTPWPSTIDPSTELVVRYHDAIPMFHPHQIKLPAMHQQHHSSALRSNVERATFVCTSEATRDDLLALYPQVEDRSVVIPTSVSGDYEPEPTDQAKVAELITLHIGDDRAARQFRRQHGGGDLRYLLVVSTVEPRKNHLRLIEAWERVRRDIDRDLVLVVVGTPGWGHGPILERIGRSGRRGGLVHLEGVANSDLRILYSNALATVCPSVAEGFDMSGIESMLCGTPVIASDIAVHRQNYADAAIYFDPYDVPDLTREIGRVAGAADDDPQLAQLVQNGFVRGAPFRHGEVKMQWSELFDQLGASRSGSARAARPQHR